MKKLNIFPVKKEKKSVLINLDAEIIQRLDEIADNEKISRTETIVCILKNYLNKRNV